MTTILIKKNDANQRLDRFLLKMFPNLTRTAIFKMIRTKKVKLNNSKTDINVRLHENDKLDLYFINNNVDTKKIDYDFMNASDKIKIVYHDDNIIVVDKPYGVIVHSNNPNQTDTLINRVLKYLYKFSYYTPENEQSFRPSLAHRLDLNTSGLIVVAKNANALRELNLLFKENKIERKYLALLYGNITPNKSEIKIWLKKVDNNRMVVQKYQTNDNKLSITRYEKLAFINNKYTLVDVSLLTGRTHQIRATFNHLGFPIVGEQKYIKQNIDKDIRYKYQCLSSYFICFHVDKNSLFYYLNNKPIKLSENEIWFLKK